MATSFNPASTFVELPNSVVRHEYSLLPAARDSLDIVESDEVPQIFLGPSMESAAAASLAFALNGNRTAPNIQWKTPGPPLTGASAAWETWITSLLKEGYKHAPLTCQSQMVTWLGKAFKLLCDVNDLWTVPAELRSFDHSLATHLESLMKQTGDADFLRRL